MIAFAHDPAGQAEDVLCRFLSLQTGVMAATDPEHQISLYLEGKGGMLSYHSTQRPRDFDLVAESPNGCAVIEGFLDGAGNDLCVADLRRAEGEFVGIQCNMQEGTVRITNDRYGARPFYWGSEGSLIAGSTDIFALREILHGKILRIDEDEAMNLAAFFQNVSNKTMWAGIQSLPPASCLTLPFGEKEQLRTYWTFPLNCEHPKTRRKPAEIARLMGESLQAAIEKRVSRSPNNFFLTLSGGIDSRFNAAAAARMYGKGVRALTVVGETSGGSMEQLELEGARGVAKALDLDHRVEVASTLDMDPVLKRHARLLGGAGMLDVTGRIESFMDLMKSEGLHLGGAPAGIVGGLITPRAIFVDPQYWECAMEGFFGCNAQLGADVLAFLASPKDEAQLRAELVSRYRRMWEQLPGETAAQGILAWTIQSRIPRFNLTTPVHTSTDCRECSPHLGYSFGEILSEVPLTWIPGKKFYAHAVGLEYPHVADIPTTPLGEPLPSNFTSLPSPPGPSRRFAMRIKGGLQRRLPNFGKKTQDRVTPRSRPLTKEKASGVLHYERLIQSPEVLEAVKSALGDYSRAWPSFIDRDQSQKFLQDLCAGNHAPRQQVKAAQAATFLVTWAYAGKSLNARPSSS